MKHLGVLPALAIFVASLLALSRPVSAQTVNHNNQLKVTGRVLPAQHVIVDEQGTITEILSNTKKDILPKVYVNKISKENIRELTPDIYEQYRRLVPEGRSRVGTLYKRPPVTYTFMPLESRIASYALPYPY